MSRAPRLASSLVLGLLLSAAAFAQTAYTVREANVRAGPERDYPVVTRLPAGTSVEVTGCNEDWSWCEVIAEPDRGWVYAGSLEYPYEGRRVVILRHGYIGLPIVPFVVGSYWDTYYRGRPWYGRRNYWVGRAPTVHRGPSIRPEVGRPVGRAPVPRGPVRGPAPRPQAVRPAPAPAPRPVHVETARPRPQPQRQQPQRQNDKPRSGRDKNSGRDRN